MKKLKSNHGESIAEVLAAALIVSLAFIFSAGSINAASKLSSKADNELDSYYTNKNSAESSTGTESDAVLVISSTEGTPLNQIIKIHMITNGDYVSYEAAE